MPKLPYNLGHSLHYNIHRRWFRICLKSYARRWPQQLFIPTPKRGNLIFEIFSGQTVGINYGNQWTFANFLSQLSSRSYRMNFSSGCSQWHFLAHVKYLFSWYIAIHDGKCMGSQGPLAGAFQPERSFEIFWNLLNLELSAVFNFLILVHCKIYCWKRFRGHDDMLWNSWNSRPIIVLWLPTPQLCHTLLNRSGL